MICNSLCILYEMKNIQNLSLDVEKFATSGRNLYFSSKTVDAFYDLFFLLFHLIFHPPECHQLTKPTLASSTLFRDQNPPWCTAGRQLESLKSFHECGQQSTSLSGNDDELIFNLHCSLSGHNLNNKFVNLNVLLTLPTHGTLKDPFQSSKSTLKDSYPNDYFFEFLSQVVPHFSQPIQPNCS